MHDGNLSRHYANSLPVGHTGHSSGSHWRTKATRGPQERMTAETVWPATLLMVTALGWGGLAHWIITHSA